MALRLPSPILTRSGAIPTGNYAFEVKWDGFRALVSRNGDFQVRSRRVVCADLDSAHGGVPWLWLRQCGRGTVLQRVRH